MRENADQKGSKYNHFSRSVKSASLRKICQYTGFLWFVFSRVRTSTILPLYGQIHVTETHMLAFFTQCMSRCKKWSFPLRISLVNMTKSAENCGFGHIFKRNPYWKTSFFVQCDNWSFLAKLSAFRQSRWYSYLIMPGVRKIVKHGLKILQRMQQDLVMCTWPSCGH